MIFRIAHICTSHYLIAYVLVELLPIYYTQHVWMLSEKHFLLGMYANRIARNHKFHHDCNRSSHRYNSSCFTFILTRNLLIPLGKTSLYLLKYIEVRWCDEHHQKVVAFCPPKSAWLDLNQQQSCAQSMPATDCRTGWLNTKMCPFASRRLWRQDLPEGADSSYFYD